MTDISTSGLPPIEQIVAEYREARAKTVDALAKKLGMSRQNLHRIVRNYENSLPRASEQDTGAKTITD